MGSIESELHYKPCFTVVGFVWARLSHLEMDPDQGEKQGNQAQGVYMWD